MSSMIDGPASYRLYPIFRRNSLPAAISAGPSTPFGELPSITPITPRPCLVFATITSTGLALGQKIEHTSGMFCTTLGGVEDAHHAGRELIHARRPEAGR